MFFCLFFFLPLSSHLVWSGYDFQCVHASIVGLRRAGDSGEQCQHVYSDCLNTGSLATASPPPASNLEYTDNTEFEGHVTCQEKGKFLTLFLFVSFYRLSWFIVHSTLAATRHRHNLNTIHTTLSASRSQKVRCFVLTFDLFPSLQPNHSQIKAAAEGRT